jgi:hypothetical protein
MTKTPNRPSTPLNDDEVTRLRLALDTAGGESAAVKALGIPRGTIARALAGLPLRAGTVMLIRERLGMGAP